MSHPPIGNARRYRLDETQSSRFAELDRGRRHGAATLGSFGPHLLMLGYTVTGAKPPATLLFFCPLHQLGEQRTVASNSNTLVIHAKQLTASGAQQ